MSDKEDNPDGCFHLLLIMIAVPVFVFMLMRILNDFSYRIERLEQIHEIVLDESR